MKKVRDLLKNKKGITLIECVIAIAVLSIICMMSFRMFSASSNILRNTAGNDEITAEATTALASSGIEEEGGTLSVGDGVETSDTEVVFTPSSKKYENGEEYGNYSTSSTTSEGTIYTYDDYSKFVAD